MTYREHKRMIDQLDKEARDRKRNAHQPSCFWTWPWGHRWACDKRRGMAGWMECRVCHRRKYDLVDM